MSRYTQANASNAGLLAETRLFLHTLGQQGDLSKTRQLLLDGGLGQRSRQTRRTIVQVLQHRLTRWSPPAWVLADLVAFAHDPHDDCLASALLLHVVRQDRLLWDFVQTVVVPRWQEGDHMLIRGDVQRFLDLAQPEHPEIAGWRHATREKLAGNVLSILRDFGLLRGRERKQIIEPVVPMPVAGHLVRLLHAEGVATTELAAHPAWHIWLWDARQVARTIELFVPQESLVH